MSSVPLGSEGMTGRSEISCRQLLKIIRPAFSVSSSTFRSSCILFLPATREPADLSLGRHLTPSEIISSAMLGPICPRLCQQEESRTPYGILSPSSAALTGTILGTRTKFRMQDQLQTNGPLKSWSTQSRSYKTVSIPVVQGMAHKCVYEV